MSRTHSTAQTCGDRDSTHMHVIIMFGLTHLQFLGLVDGELHLFLVQQILHYEDVVGGNQGAAAEEGKRLGRGNKLSIQFIQSEQSLGICALHQNSVLL